MVGLPHLGRTLEIIRLRTKYPKSRANYAGFYAGRFRHLRLRRLPPPTRRREGTLQARFAVHPVSLPEIQTGPRRGSSHLADIVEPEMVVVELPLDFFHRDRVTQCDLEMLP